MHAASDTRKDERGHKSPARRGITSVGGFSLPDTCVIESVIFRDGDSVHALYVMYAIYIYISKIAPTFSDISMVRSIDLRILEKFRSDNKIFYWLILGYE